MDILAVGDFVVQIDAVAGTTAYVPSVGTTIMITATSRTDSTFQIYNGTLSGFLFTANDTERYGRMNMKFFINNTNYLRMGASAYDAKYWTGVQVA